MEREQRLENLVIEALDYLNQAYVEQKHLIIRILRELDLDNNEIRGYFTGDIIVPLNSDDEEQPSINMVSTDGFVETAIKGTVAHCQLLALGYLEMS